MLGVAKKLKSINRKGRKDFTQRSQRMICNIFLTLRTLRPTLRALRLKES
jgi:hypothetical protein